MRIGIDVGGTFTDLVLYDERNGRTVYHKLASTPQQPHLAPLHGIRALLAQAGAQPGDISFVGLGTTVATNVLLQRKGSRTGLITTAGFRDLLEIGRQQRPLVFDPFTAKPVPLIPRELRIGVRERIAYDGSVLAPLAEDEVLAAVARLRDEDVRSIAVCFLHSYANPAHERRAAELVTHAWPEVHVVASAELVPEFREYERLSTTVVNAYLAESMHSYLSQFTRAIAALGIAVEPVVLGSSGGVLRPLLAVRRPVDTLFSGPSGGVSGAAFVAAAGGIGDTINLDMGGTSTEVCVVRDGTPERTHARFVEGFPLKLTSVAVHTIGAGGSSIAWIDAGGLLHVGPQSVGADPGPACYGRGGSLPTVTDANVVLGRLNPSALLGGALPIDAGRAAAAIERHIARPRGISVPDAAAAIIAVSNNAIVQAIRVVSTQRGLDPADYVLVAYGGAGPLHAGPVALELGIAEVLIPDAPGLLCALGVLAKDVEMDVSASRLIRDDAPAFRAVVGETFDALLARAVAELSASGARTEELTVTAAIDTRYAGQNFELPVALDPAEPDLRETLRARFHEMHRAEYGYADEARALELVTFRMRVARRGGALPPLAPGAAPPAQAGAPANERPVFFEEADGFVSCAVYARSRLSPGDVVAGPAVVEQMDTTTIVPPGLVATVDAHRNLRLGARVRAEWAA